MKFIMGILALLTVAWAVPAQAALSGTYRCEAGFGDEGLIWHHNPASIPQVVRRVRIYNNSGVLVFDSGAIVGVVPARGSAVIINAFAGEQTLVTWSQAADTVLPLPRLDMFVGTTSIGRTNCP